MRILIPDQYENERFYSNVEPGELFTYSGSIYLKGTDGKCMDVSTGTQKMFPDACNVELIPDYVLAHKSFLKEGAL